MLSSVRKNLIRSLVILPLTASHGFAQSPIGTLPESISVSALAFSTQTNDLFVNQWVQLDESGTVKGSVVALRGQDSMSLSEMRVTLSQNGKRVLSSDTDAEGEFSLENVIPGLYTLTAEGAESMAVFSLVVLDRISGKHLPNAFSVRVMPLTGRVSEILRGQSSLSQVSYDLPKSDPLGMSRKISVSHQVMLDNQGTLTGRLGKAAAAVDMSKMTVFILKDGEEIRRARVTADGSFSVSGLAPACYGLIAAGERGVAATGFCAVDGKMASVTKNREIFVSQTGQVPSGLNIEIADPVMSEAPTEFELAEDPAMYADPVGMGPGFGGGAGGGGFGGGGGASGGGGIGIGGIAAIGGLAAVAIVAAADKNNDPVSPVVPKP